MVQARFLCSTCFQLLDGYRNCYEDLTFPCACCRHYRTGVIGAAFTGRSSTGRERGSRWCTSCALGRTRSSGPRWICYAKMGSGGIPTSPGLTSSTSRSRIIERTTRPSRASSSGSYPPTTVVAIPTDYDLTTCHLYKALYI